MPDIYIKQTPVGFGAAMSVLAEMLVSAGWSYLSSGDGLTGYSATGKIFTHTGAGALGWNNAKAWARLTDPANVREFVLQHDATGGARIKYSAVNKFTGGTPSATVTPSATGERTIRGGGTDATPTYGAGWFHSSTATGGAAYLGFARGTAPYGFWFAGTTVPASTAFTALMLDPVISVPQDPDPVVIHCASTNSYKAGGYGSLDNEFITTESTAWPAPGGANEGIWGYMNVPMTQFASLLPSIYVIGGDYGGAVLNTSAYCIQNDGLGVNPFNSLCEALPILYMRLSAVTAPYGIKGRSLLARWTTIARTPALTATMDSRRWICVGDLWLPWDGITAPLA